MWDAVGSSISCSPVWLTLADGCVARALLDPCCCKQAHSQHFILLQTTNKQGYDLCNPSALTRALDTKCSIGSSQCLPLYLYRRPCTTTGDGRPQQTRRHTHRRKC